MILRKRVFLKWYINTQREGELELFSQEPEQEAADNLKKHDKKELQIQDDIINSDNEGDKHFDNYLQPEDQENPQPEFETIHSSSGGPLTSRNNFE